MPRATDLEIADRVSFIFEALVSGVLTTEMFPYVSAKKPDWAVSERQVRNYTVKAKNKLRELTKRQNKYQLGKSLARLELLYQRNMLVQDFGTALQSEKERNKLLGLYAPAKSAIDLTSKGNAITGLTVTIRRKGKEGASGA